MHSDSHPVTLPARSPVLRFRRPIWTLILLAPFLAEVLSGSTRLSVLFAFIPEAMTWGCGALLARELVRRWRAGATSLLLLGMALSVAEEFVIQQTSLAPLPFPGANAAFGRYLGINWVYFVFMLAYESVWVVVVPVQVAELLFPEHRDRPWLRKRGLIATCIVFLLGCRIAWYGWTQRVLPMLHVPPYHPPIATILLGLAAIATLIWVAYLIRDRSRSGRTPIRKVAPAWLYGAAAFLFGGPWWYLMTLIFSPRPEPPASLVLAGAVAWGLLAFAIFRHGSDAPGWTDSYRWAVSFGAVLACMIPGTISTAGWTRADLVFKDAVDLLAIVGLIMLGLRIRRRHLAA